MEQLVDSEEYRHLISLYQCAIMEIETKFNVLNTQFTVNSSYNPIDTIKRRLKSPASIAEKLERRGLPLTVDSIRENLSDVAGVRILCPFEEDIYSVADTFLSQDDITLVEKKDYIKRPKSNGYRSLHLIVEVPIFVPEGKQLVRVEIQLRTIAMELWAELEHRMRYKQDLDPALAESLSEELRACADSCAELDLRMGNAHRKIDACRTFASTPTSMFPRIKD